jgi:hypothetical protein
VQPGTTRRPAAMADRSQHTVRMAAQPQPVPITHTPGSTARRARPRTHTETGEVRLRCAEISGRRRDMHRIRKALRQAFAPRKEREVPATAERAGIAASSRKARTTMCTRARMEMSTARTLTAVGRNMTTAAGRIRLPNQHPIRRMLANDKEPRQTRVLLGERPADPAHRNSQQSPRARFSNSIETPRHDKEEPSKRGNSNNRAAQIDNWEAAARAVAISKVTRER